MPNRPSPLSRIQELETRVAAALTKLEQFTPGLAPIVEQSHAELSYVQADIEQLKARLTDTAALQAQVEAQATTIRDLGAALQGLNARLTALEKKKLP